MLSKKHLDTIQGVSAVKAAGRESVFAAKTRAIYGRFQDAAFALGSVGVRFNFSAEIVGSAILLVVLA